MKLIHGVALVLVLAACGREGTETADTTAAPVPAAASGSDRAVTAAMIANAIAARPAAADSILRANNHTPESFERLMFEIAGDSVLSATYASARTP